jgi:hypothetical protein
MLTEMQRAAMLDGTLYDEVAGDPSTMLEAFQVVLVVTLAAGLGDALGVLLLRGTSTAATTAFVVEVASTFVGWVVWAALTWAVGSLLGGRATFGGMLRAEGYALAPYLLAFWGFIPFAGGLIRFVALVWVVVAGTVAIRDALRVTTGQAIATVVISLVALAVVSGILGVVLAVLGLFSGLFGPLPGFRPR